MKRQIGCLFLILACAVPALGATYEGLTPGRSTRAEADKALGAPVQILSGGRTLAYDSAGHDLKALSVRLREDKQTIAVIKLTFLKPYAAAMVRKWFSLKEPDKTDIDLLGRRTETYTSKGIMLHFTGASPDEPVAGLSHIETPDEVKSHMTATKPAPKHVPAYLGLILPKTATYGLRVINTYADSPAEAAGLKMGDEILMVDGRDVSGGKLNTAGFDEIIASKNAHDPVDLRIRRGEQVLGIDITLAAFDSTALEKRRKADEEQALVLYRQALDLKDKKEYAKAATLYTQALPLDPTGNNIYTYLALCHHRLGRHAEAEPLLKASLGLADKTYSNYLLGTVCMAQGRYDEAAKVLEHAIELRDPEATKVFDYEELGICYMKLGRHAEARQILQAGYRINSGRYRLTYLLAQSNDKLGRSEDAVKYYQRYLEFNTADDEWKAYAKKRLAALKPAPSAKKKSGKDSDALVKGIFKAIDTVNKEMKDFNRD
jgi:tetratricopeptide (TPR) repeat protein